MTTPRPWAWFLGAAAALIGVSMAKKKASSKRKGEPIISSLDELQPAFRVQLERLLELMRADGYAPRVFETKRSDARVAELVAKGTGSVGSLHPLGLAADIIDEKLGWKASPDFWRALGENAAQLGLGRVQHTNPKTGKTELDLPHVQALPGRFDAQLRAMPTALRDAFLTARYAAA